MEMIASALAQPGAPAKDKRSGLQPPTPPLAPPASSQTPPAPAGRIHRRRPASPELSPSAHALRGLARGHSSQPHGAAALRSALAAALRALEASRSETDELRRGLLEAHMTLGELLLCVKTFHIMYRPGQARSAALGADSHCRVRLPSSGACLRNPHGCGSPGPLSLRQNVHCVCAYQALPPRAWQPPDIVVPWAFVLCAAAAAREAALRELAASAEDAEQARNAYRLQASLWRPWPNPCQLSQEVAQNRAGLPCRIP
jgi:hypothetical protein